MDSGNMFPFTDELVNEWFQRTFDEDVHEEEMIWHRDKKDRKITVLEGDGWQFQFDNQMPVEIEQGDVIEIPKYSYHRLIKGNTKLILQIEEK